MVNKLNLKNRFHYDSYLFNHIVVKCNLPLKLDENIQ